MHFPGRILTILQIVNILVQTEAVNLARLNALSREELLQLDREVSQFYNESYSDLDGREKPVGYDEQLLKAMRSLRHTVVLNLYDFKYSRNETKWKSMGAKVDVRLCKQQLRLLVALAKKFSLPNQFEQAPLSVIDFLQASGQVGSGTLNGNFAWLGSYNSCIRSKIPVDLWRKYLGMAPQDYETTTNKDINGRYCVAHLRAKSWPKSDDYFEDRLTLKRGICMPDSCHSAVYELDQEMIEMVDYLARFNLLAPFNGDRYETSDLYCLPDEDSPFRQMDLGGKLFIVFIGFWILLTAYTNVKYYKRQSAMQKLRETVDIKMVINERLDDLANYRSQNNGCEDEDDDHHQRHGVETESNEMPPPPPPPPSVKVMDQLELIGCGSGGQSTGSGASSTVSSVASTPLPSGIDEDDSDTPYSLLKPFSQRRRKKRSKNKPANYSYATSNQVSNTPERAQQMDLVQAFSFEANLDFLFKPRLNPIADFNSSQRLHQQQQHSTTASLIKRNSQQLASVARRSSSLNEALVKDLHKYRDSLGGGDHQTTSQVTIVTSESSGSGGGQGTGERKQESSARVVKASDKSDLWDADGRGGRVNIDVLDGLKVIATSWIVWGHTMMFFFGLVVDLRFGSERMFDMTMLTTINTLQVVGLFYIITGCLLTYFSFQRAKSKHLLNPLFWLMVLIGRYIRLIPAYALVFWFARHVAPHTGSGPGFYDYRTDDEHARTACSNESWWVMWTMSAADIKIPFDCIPQAWYLSDDFRTLMVLPIYVLLLAKSTLMGYSAIFATFIYSNLKLTETLREANIDYKILLNWHPHVYALMADRLHEVYTNPAVRMSTYLLGVIVGHLLHLYQSRQIRQWPGWFRAWAMKLALVMAAGFFMGAPLLASPLINQFLPAKADIDSNLVVLVIPLFKTAMELAIAIIILLLVTGGGFTFIRRLMASQAMKILSNLSYAVFLTHIEIMYKLPAFQLDSDYWHLFKHAVFFIVISHVLAFFLHLFFEMPINNITRRLFKWAFGKFN